MDSPKLIIVRADKETQGVHHRMVGYSVFGTHTKIRSVALLPKYSEKDLEYPLITKTMTRRQCNYMESPTMCAALQASGITFNLQRDVVAGTLT